MTKRAWSALMVAVAVIALLAVSFVPHHHHNGFMCLADEHYSCSDSHGTDVADVLGEADSCTAAAHHWHCDGNSGLCDGKEGHCGGGSGHNDDRSYCIEDEAFLNYRTENYQMHLLPHPVHFFIAIAMKIGGVTGTNGANYHGRCGFVHNHTLLCAFLCKMDKMLCTTAFRLLYLEYKKECGETTAFSD